MKPYFYLYVLYTYLSMTHYSAEELLKVEWLLGGARSCTVDKGRGGGGIVREERIGTVSTVGYNDFDFFLLNGASQAVDGFQIKC